MTDDTKKTGEATRREALLGLGGAIGAALAAGAGVSVAAAQMAQGHREVRPGTPPLQGLRVIERSAVLSGRLAGLLLADQGGTCSWSATPARRRAAWTTPSSTAARSHCSRALSPTPPQRTSSSWTATRRSRACRIRFWCGSWQHCPATMPMATCRTTARRT